MPQFKAGTLATDSPVIAYRWLYEQLVGPIPVGHEIDHVKARGCKGRPCVEISHLEAVTPAENQRRARLEVCKAGKHDLTIAENLLWTKRGTRAGCKICKEETRKATAARNLRKRHEENPYMPWHLDVCRSGRHDLTDPANIRWGKDGERHGCLPCSVEKRKISDAAKWQRKKLQREQG